MSGNSSPESEKFGHGSSNLRQPHVDTAATTSSNRSSENDHCDVVKVYINMMSHDQRAFDTKAELQIHTQVHMREAKPYACQQCPKKFANSSYLSQHMRIHKREKPFGPCKYCGRMFTQLSHLQQHIRTHTGDKPYKCKHPGCEKAFSQLSNLQSHSRCHQSDKPYKCNSCYKCFTEEQQLLEHIPKHKESKHLKVHICQYCGKSYNQATYLAKHMTIKHNERVEREKRGLDIGANLASSSWQGTSGIGSSATDNRSAGLNLHSPVSLLEAQQSAAASHHNQSQAPQSQQQHSSTSNNDNLVSGARGGSHSANVAASAASVYGSTLLDDALAGSQFPIGMAAHYASGHSGAAATIDQSAFSRLAGLAGLQHNFNSTTRNYFNYENIRGNSTNSSSGGGGAAHQSVSAATIAASSAASHINASHTPAAFRHQLIRLDDIQRYAGQAASATDSSSSAVSTHQFHQSLLGAAARHYQ